jgi:integrase
MSRVTTARQAATIGEGKHSTDTRRLYLFVRGGSRSWVFRYTMKGKQKQISLGVQPIVSFKDAREQASAFSVLISQGKDPQESAVPDDSPTITTFTQVAARYIRIHRHGWSNAKHARQWVSTLKTYARPVIGNKPVDAISTEDVLEILTPIWTNKTETAKRVQGRLENILDFAAAHQWRDPLNPARWRGHLDKLLPKPSRVKKVKHHPAMPYEQAPAFMAELKLNKCLSSKALQLLILTATRTSEVLKAQWREIDIEAAEWRIPAERMKGKQEHRVPLCKAALSILATLPRIEGNPYLFPSVRQNKSLSNMALLQLMRGMGYGVGGKRGDYVPHGFRSSFRDWSGEVSSFPRDVCEMALAHVIENRVEAAYRRGDLFTKRRNMMEEWAQWCNATTENNS